MSEPGPRIRRDERAVGVGRRGPAGKPAAVADTSWQDGMPAVLAEHRGSLADAEADAAYRWAAVAAPGRDVIDIGCGAGHGSAILLDAGAASVLGTDHDHRAVETATRLYGDRARFMAAEVLALPLAPASFGLITCFAAIEETPDPIAAIEAIARLLTADGMLAVSLPTEPSRDPISGEPRGPRRTPAEWEQILGERFEAVRVFRRRTSLASTILPVANGDGSTDPEIAELAWVGGDPGEERSVLALTGAGELPDPPARSSVVGCRDLRAYRDTIAAWEQRARRAEADGAAKHWELVASREAQRRLRKRLWHLEHTPLRRFFRLIRGRPARLSEGPPIRPPELQPEPWD